MQLKRIKEKLKDFWTEYRRTKIGIAGLALLVLLIVMAIIPWFVLDIDTYRKWYLNPRWDLNPPLAPPEWVNEFVSKKYTPWRKLEPIESMPLYLYIAKQMNYSQPELLKQYFRGYVYVFEYSYVWDIPTKNIVLLLKGVNQSVKISIDIERPPQIGVAEQDRYLKDIISGVYTPKEGEIRLFFVGKEITSIEA
ncbi:MAG TPA: hypothetical protein ENF93_01285, partial [Ignisphaera sp.]|nr:hypothetical protein [Ignisphaera sp.]